MEAASTVSIKVNLLTFVKYSQSFIKNVIWIYNFRSLPQIVTSIYDEYSTELKKTNF